MNTTSHNSKPNYIFNTHSQLGSIFPPKLFTRTVLISSIKRSSPRNFKPPRYLDQDKFFPNSIPLSLDDNPINSFSAPTLKRISVSSSSRAVSKKTKKKIIFSLDIFSLFFSFFFSKLCAEFLGFFFLSFSREKSVETRWMEEKRKEKRGEGHKNERLAPSKTLTRNPCDALSREWLKTVFDSTPWRGRRDCWSRSRGA